MFTLTASRPTASMFRAANTAAPMPIRAGGVMAGTLVETADGWRAVERLEPGARVHTFDGGLRTLVAAVRQGIGAAGGRLVNLIKVPGGALDTCSDLTLLADQRVLLDMPEAEAMIGSPLVLVPGAALEGWSGITSISARSAVTAISLIFEDEEVIYANTGALLHCPAADTINNAQTSEFFDTLSYDQTRQLLGLGRDVRRGPTRAMPQPAIHVA